MNKIQRLWHHHANKHHRKKTIIGTKFLTKLSRNSKVRVTCPTSQSILQNSKPMSNTTTIPNNLQGKVKAFPSLTEVKPLEINSLIEENHWALSIGQRLKSTDRLRMNLNIQFNLIGRKVLRSSIKKS